ncbi:DNA-deoxyinosine glycosylase [Myxococcota bacterium]|nr:DNA-deoxyinosine glycosylase [Myxococcota bacterium]
MGARLVGFPPVARPDARVLILGSMPGAASLAAHRYYGHPRNHFWPIMGALFGAGLELDYPARLERLVASRVALWDVLAACEREGSLDAAIDPKTAAPNDFYGFFDNHQNIRAIFFNGSAAADLFERRVAPTLSTAASAIERVRLPSTSPAHAAMTFDAKLARWRAVATFL